MVWVRIQRVTDVDDQDDFQRRVGESLCGTTACDGLGHAPASPTVAAATTSLLLGGSARVEQVSRPPASGQRSAGRVGHQRWAPRASRLFADSLGPAVRHPVTGGLSSGAAGFVRLRILEHALVAGVSVDVEEVAIREQRESRTISRQRTAEEERGASDRPHGRQGVRHRASLAVVALTDWVLYGGGPTADLAH